MRFASLSQKQHLPHSATWNNVQLNLEGYLSQVWMKEKGFLQEEQLGVKTYAKIFYNGTIESNAYTPIK